MNTLQFFSLYKVAKNTSNNLIIIFSVEYKFKHFSLYTDHNFLCNHFCLRPVTEYKEDGKRCSLSVGDIWNYSARWFDADTFTKVAAI